MAIRIKRIYESSSPEDGYRVLIDRLWPRGIKKSEAQLDIWQKDLAPSHELRKWFQHDPEKWEEFKERYYSELEGQSALLEALRKRAKTAAVTIVFAAKDIDHSNARALKELLEKQNDS